MDLIADTNVWYDIGASLRQPSKLKAAGNRLVATPTSFLEIASPIEDRNIEKRRSAARAVVEHADAVVEDCECHLALIWGFAPPTLGIDWREAFVAVTKARSAQELTQGVRDFQESVVRKVSLPLAKFWRDYHWRGFHDKVVDAIDEDVPGYRAARQAGKPFLLDKVRGSRLALKLRSPEARRTFTVATFHRALLKVARPLADPTEDDIARVTPLVSPYVDAYVEYLIGCATEFAPQPNDLGDSECFIYLQRGSAFLSSDKRWVAIAKKACPSFYWDPDEQRELHNPIE